MGRAESMTPMIRCLFVSLVLAIGAACSPTDSDPTLTQEMTGDVARLVTAAKQLDTAWPWQPAIPEVEQVARHGLAVAAALLAELRYESEEQWGSGDWDLHVEQQVALALCRIFDVTPESGRTVFGIRATAEQNSTVREFWRARVATALQSASGNR